MTNPGDLFYFLNLMVSCVTEGNTSNETSKPMCFMANSENGGHMYPLSEVLTDKSVIYIYIYIYMYI